MVELAIKRLPIDPETVQRIGRAFIAEGRDEETGNLFQWWRPVENVEQGQKVISRHDDSVLGVGTYQGNGIEKIYDYQNLGVWRKLDENEKKQIAEASLNELYSTVQDAMEEDF